MQLLLILALVLPLLGALILLVSSRWIDRHLSGIVASSSIFLSFLLFLFLLAVKSQEPIELVLYSWIPIPLIDAHFSLYLDDLSLLMALIITGIGFLIHVYSIGYMDHEEDYARYFACLNFFVFAMLLLVLAGNLLLLFVGWEGVGLASYLLIGFWYQRKKAAAAATKAFIVNRIGDAALLLGLLMAFSLFGTSDISTIANSAHEKFVSDHIYVIILTLLLFIGATGKSAQIPLHVWLPDAMEGPTPVSALIHAATMVTAGVYLVVRLHLLFLLAPSTLFLIGIVGALTSLVAALAAVGQTDLKRVLAYSTISQLGFMFLACGVGAFYSAMFHLTTHAFVKALLFLSAGNVVHMLHGETSMRSMGGLAKRFPVTNWFFLIGVLALSGVPPLATFFSKDLILEVEHELGPITLYIVGLITTFLTGFYMTRAYCLTFHGEPKEIALYKSATEAPKVMLAPISILAILSLFGGFLGFCFCPMPILESFLDELRVTKAEEELSYVLFLQVETWIAIGVTLVAILAAAFLYTRKASPEIGKATPLLKAFYFDEIYRALFVVPLSALASWIAKWVEPTLFAGSITGVSRLANKASLYLQRMQSGQIRSYASWMIAGISLVLLYINFRR